jgi:acetyl esterase/lipase
MDSKRHPVVLFFHGGALINGGRGGVKLGLSRFCVEQGWVMVSADYRLGPEIKAPQIMEDVRDLIAWVREKGPELFGADPDNIIAAGSSAGGYLALAAGTMNPRPKAILSLWGYGDILADWYTKPCAPYTEYDVDKDAAYAEVYGQVLTETGKRKGVPPQRTKIYPYLRHEGLWTNEMTGFDPETQRDRIVPLCPRFNVTPNYPPTLLLHGELDDDVPVSESINMAAALKGNGVEHELLVLPGAGHTLKNATDGQLAEAAAKAQAFLRRHLAAAR